MAARRQFSSSHSWIESIDDVHRSWRMLPASLQLAAESVTTCTTFSTPQLLNRGGKAVSNVGTILSK